MQIFNKQLPNQSNRIRPSSWWRKHKLKGILMIGGLVVFLLSLVFGILIVQKQRQSRQSLAPNAPASKPAASEGTCSRTIEIVNPTNTPTPTIPLAGMVPEQGVDLAPICSVTPLSDHRYHVDLHWNSDGSKSYVVKLSHLKKIFYKNSSGITWTTNRITWTTTLSENLINQAGNIESYTAGRRNSRSNFVCHRVRTAIPPRITIAITPTPTLASRQPTNTPTTTPTLTPNEPTSTPTLTPTLAPGEPTYTPTPTLTLAPGEPTYTPTPIPTATPTQVPGVPTNTLTPTPTTTYSCNADCTADSQCQAANANYVCASDYGNKCRLDTNRASTGCQPAANTYACNSSCTTTAQCQTVDSHYVCATDYGSKCRLSSNLTATNCQPAIYVTPTPALGCNDVCSSNADCANPDYICYQTPDGSNHCRLDNYPNSDNCTQPKQSVITPTPAQTTQAIAQANTVTAQGQPTLPASLPVTGPADWANWLKAGLATMGIGAALLLLL